MDQKQDYKVKYEKGKIHITYLLIIAVILAVIGFSLAFGGNSEALGQISMASTVSSIILSAIAIFMSISGEYKLTYTHNKLLETSDRMSNITVDIEKANSLLESTINDKLLSLDERLEQIGRSVGKVEKEMFNRTLDTKEDSSVDISDDVLWNVYCSLIGNKGVNQEAVGLMEYLVLVRSQGRSLNYDNFRAYLKSVIGDDNIFSEGIVWGLLSAFVEIGYGKIETAKYFKDRMSISAEKIKEIEKYL